MAVLFSKQFSIPKHRLQELGVFDVFLDKDSSFFINIKALQNCTIPEFAGSYDRVNGFFREIGMLLKGATPHGKIYNTALRKFNFPEVNGINLGFAEGKHGAGFGTQLRQQIIKDAYEIIQNGCNQPEIFHLVSLFEDNVGPDRLSDMIARIIYPDIVAFTKRVYAELGITQENYPRYHFKDGLVKNPLEPYYLLLLPESILHELPIARCWDDISRVCAENEAIRNEINELVSEEWSKMSIAERKEYLREEIFKNPDKARRVLEAYKMAQPDDYCIYRNPEYLADYLTNTYSMPTSTSNNSYDAAIDIVENFKEWVEFHRGNTIIHGKGKPLKEKAVQILVHAVAQMFCKAFNWDFSPETDSGRGPVDFKVSRGSDKTVIEGKLTSNQDCVHGLEVQIEEYAKAENTQNKIYMLVDTGIRSDRIKDVERKRKEMETEGLSPATVIVIDAVPKDSASKYIPPN